MAKSPVNRKKDNESKFLENLIEFLSDPEGLTDKEIKEYFWEDSNVDIDAMSKNFKSDVQRLLAQRNRELMKMKADENRHIFEERSKRISQEIENDMHMDKEGLIERLMAIMKSPSLELAVHHRNLSNMPYEDLMKIYKELQILLEDSSGDNDHAAS